VWRIRSVKLKRFHLFYAGCHGTQRNGTQHKWLIYYAQPDNILPLCWVWCFIYCYAGYFGALRRQYTGWSERNLLTINDLKKPNDPNVKRATDLIQPRDAKVRWILPYIGVLLTALIATSTVYVDKLYFTLTLRLNKLGCLSLTSQWRLVYYLQTGQEPALVEEHFSAPCHAGRILICKCLLGSKPIK